jgi:hypothetical protein
MARLIFEYNDRQFDFMRKLVEIFPQVRAQMLGYVGKEGKTNLKTKLLSGQSLNLRKYPEDKRGRRTVGYSINRRADMVSISSYPVNLFERGRRLRGGKKEPARNIIRGRLKGIMQSDLQRILNEFDNKFLDKEMKKI